MWAVGRVHQPLLFTGVLAWWKLRIWVTPLRLELRTHRLRVCCSTNWATESKSIGAKLFKDLRFWKLKDWRNIYINVLIFVLNLWFFSTLNFINIENILFDKQLFLFQDIVEIYIKFILAIICYPIVSNWILLKFHPEQIGCPWH